MPYICYNCRGRSGIPGRHCTFKYHKFTDTCASKNCTCECREFYIDMYGKKQPIYIPHPTNIKGGLDNWV